MYHDFDIPSPLKVSPKSLVDFLRAMRKCMSIDLRVAYQSIHLLIGKPLSGVPSYVTRIYCGSKIQTSFSTLEIGTSFFWLIEACS